MRVGEKITLETNHSAGNPWLTAEIECSYNEKNKNSTHLNWTLYAHLGSEKEIEIREYYIIMRVLDEYSSIKPNQDYTVHWKATRLNPQDFAGDKPIKVTQNGQAIKTGALDVAHDFMGKLNRFQMHLKCGVMCHEFPNAKPENQGEIVYKEFEAGNPTGKEIETNIEDVDIASVPYLKTDGKEFGKTWSVAGEFIPTDAQSVPGADKSTVEKSYSYRVWYRYEYDLEDRRRGEKLIFSTLNAGFDIPLEDCFNSKTDGNIIFYLQTESAISKASGIVGEVKTLQCNIHVPDSVLPTMSEIRKEDMTSNNTVKSWNVAVESFSDFQLTVDAKGIYGSEIQKIVLNGDVPETTTTNATRISARTGVLGAGEKTFNAYCIDSRGRKSELTTLKINVFPYGIPKILKFQVTRDISTSVVTVLADWDWSLVDNKNKVNTSLFYKTMTGSWQTYPASVNKNTPTVLQGTFPIKDAYYFQFAVKDSLGNTTYYTIKVANSPKMFDFLPNNSGLGIGRKCETDGLEIAFNTTFFGDIELFNAQGEKVTLEQYILDVVKK